MTDIKDILKQHEVNPSPDCWDKLSSRLDIAMPQGAENAASSVSSSQAGHFLGTVASKIVAGVIGAVAVATVVTVAVMSDKKPQLEEKAPISKTDTLPSYLDFSDTVLSEPVSPTVLVYTDNTSEEPVSSVEVTSSANSVQVHEPVSSEPAVPSGTTSSPAREAERAESHTPHTQAKPENVRPSAVTQTTPVAQTVQQDPVVQSLAEDAVDWTPPVKLEIPNVFTPNGDGYNDKFVIMGLENCVQRKLMVYNRAGQMVYRSNSYENTWDGGDCPDGVYRYQFTYTGFNGIEQTLSGVVNIIRR